MRPEVRTGSALAGLQQGDAAVRIAERNGGTVTVALLAQIFVEVGLTRASGKLAHGQAAMVLGESDHFERVVRGTYRLRSCSRCANADGEMRQR